MIAVDGSLAANLRFNQRQDFGAGRGPKPVVSIEIRLTRPGDAFAN